MPTLGERRSDLLIKSRTLVRQACFRPAMAASRPLALEEINLVMQCWEQRILSKVEEMLVRERAANHESFKLPSQLAAPGQAGPATFWVDAVRPVLRNLLHVNKFPKHVDLAQAANDAFQQAGILVKPRFADEHEQQLRDEIRELRSSETKKIRRLFHAIYVSPVQVHVPMRAPETLTNLWQDLRNKANLTTVMDDAWALVVINAQLQNHNLKQIDCQRLLREKIEELQFLHTDGVMTPPPLSLPDLDLDLCV